MMRFLPVLAFAAMAFAECPAPKQCMDSEFLCSGPYDEKTGCYAMDTCMQMKDSNGCPGNCATFCSEKDQLCPGGVDYNGCPQKDFCAPSDSFCPAMCGKGEMVCSGGFDEMGKQMAADYCIPEKNGDCPAHCPVQCAKGEMMCPGGVDESGCQMPDFCHWGEFCPVSCKMEEMTCSGDWDYKTGKQMSSDYCIPMKNGDCYNNCHVSCCEESQLCPGGDYNGCPQPDFCYPKDVECPKY